MTTQPTTPAVTARTHQAAAEAIERIRRILDLSDVSHRAVVKAIDAIVDEYDDECWDIRTEGRV